MLTNLEIKELNHTFSSRFDEFELTFNQDNLEIIFKNSKDARWFEKNVVYHENSEKPIELEYSIEPMGSSDPKYHFIFIVKDIKLLKDIISSS